MAEPHIKRYLAHQEGATPTDWTTEDDMKFDSLLAVIP